MAEKALTVAPTADPIALPPQALESLTRAEIDSQISTAHRFRRSVSTFLQQATQLATVDSETAAGCNYVVPRDGKQITGPGIRLAEIVASTWGNLRVGARVISDEGRAVVAQGWCHDLETNLAITMEVRRRITDRHGRRYSDDMVNTTANAACSIARRNAILAVVPRGFVDKVAAAAKAVAVGTQKTLVERRTRLVAVFKKKWGIDLDRILARLLADTGVPHVGIDDITLDDFESLVGLHTAITDGVTTPAEAFPDPRATPVAVDPGASKSERLAAELTLTPPPADGDPPAEGGDLMFTSILLTVVAAFVTGYAAAVARYGYLRHDVDRLRARYRELVAELARVQGTYPPPLRLMRGGTGTTAGRGPRR